MASVPRLESFSNRIILLTVFALLLIGAIRFSNLFPATRAAATVQNSVSVTSVSAASYVGYPATLGHSSIAAAFGTQLSTGVQAAPGQPLPMALAGTSVTVAGVPAQLFFVSPEQVNYLVPPNVPAGDAQVVVTALTANGDQIVSKGQIRIAGNAPAIFTANASGAGVPAAVTGRINASNQFVFDPTPPFEFDPVTPGRLIPSPIDVGTADRPAFLILYATGLRNAAVGSVKAVIGGLEIPITPVEAPGFTGLDQINLQIPLSLKGRGLVDLAIVAAGVSSNTVTVNLAGTPSAILSITGFSVTEPAVAGQTISIAGNGFSTNVNDNVVRFGSAQARVIAATPGQLTVMVPFGAESGKVLIQTPQGETRSVASFRVKTSVSGLIQTAGSISAEPSPLEGVAVRVVGTNITARSNREGAFVIPDIPVGPAQLEVDGATTNSTPPFPRITLKKTILAERDNQFTQTISLQQASGGSGTVGSFDSVDGSRLSVVGEEEPLAGNQWAISFKQLVSTLNSSVQSSATDNRQPTTDNRLLAKQQSTGKSTIISNGGVSLEVPLGTTVRFPDGKTRGSVQLTVVNRSRLPGLALPAGVYSSTIAQITPLGTEFSPGASLTFPNPDQTNLPPGAKVDLYRYDSTSGNFIRRGTATVSADRARVVADARSVDVASYWFAAVPSGVTTVIGKVVNESNAPVSRAKVTVNGRSSLTDANGGFSIADVATAGNTQIQAEVVWPRQWASTPRGTSAQTNVVVGGITNVGTITLTNTNVTGLALSPFVVDFKPSDAPKKVDVTLTQPAAAGGLAVSLTSGNTAVATVPASVTIAAGQTTASFNVTRIGAGATTIQAKATVGGTALETFAVVTVASAAPVLTAANPTSAAAGTKITISGTGFSSVPRNNVFGMFRGNNLVWIFNPERNENLTDSAGKISVRLEVPPVGAGAVTIRAAVVNLTTGVLSDLSAPLNFTVIATTVPTPALTSVSPGQGKPRDRVTITGSNFSTSLFQNVVIFKQGNEESSARIVQASATQLVVEVPSYDIVRGPALILVSRVASDGAKGTRSNALEFNITEEVTPPVKPTLASLVNTANQQPSGRDGNTIRATGANFGLNYVDVRNLDLANDEPLISILLFYQNNQYANFALPTGAQGGTQLTATVPTGMVAGPAQVTIATFDLETGLFSDESAPVNFTVTATSLRLIDEDEPNNSPDTATELIFPVIVSGSASLNDPAEFVVQLTGGRTEKLHDMFYLKLDKDTPLTISLGFLLLGDLDLFLLQENANGDLAVVASSARGQTLLEQLSGTFKAGEYYIAVGAFTGGSGYLLTVTQGASLNGWDSPVSFGDKQPMWVERKQ
ncbi:MAG: IPT/TIG domain-containing protein [Blastocatellia bacterium]